MRRSCLFLFALAAHCGASVRPTITDGSAGDASTGACRWTPSAAFAVTPDGDLRWRLLAATSIGTGAHIALQRTQDDGSSQLATATALDDERATPRATVRSLTSVPRAPSGRAIVASVTATPAADTRWALFESDGAPCLLARQSVDGPSIMLAIEPNTLGMGFSLAGCRSIGRTASGVSFFSEQIRAQWGTDMLTLDEDGRFSARESLPQDGTSPSSPTTRTMFADRSFVTLAVFGGRSNQELRLRRFDASSMPRGDVELIASVAIAPKSLSIVETTMGMLALWDNAVDTLPPVFGLATRALDANARPVASSIEHAELGMLAGSADATRFGASIVGTGRFLDGTPRQRFFELDQRGQRVGAPVEIPVAMLGAAPATSKIVATSTGALVLTERSVGSSGGQVIAIPVRCAQ